MGTRYNTGETFTVNLRWARAVDVTGSPLLALGGCGRATYSAGTGTTTMTFSYTVQVGDFSTRLDWADIHALTLNGGEINDAHGNPVDLTLPQPGSPESLAGQTSIGVNADPVGDLVLRGRPAGTITLAGNVGSAALGSGALAGTIDLAGVMAGGLVDAGAIDGAIALDGAAGGASTAAASLTGTITLAGAATGASTAAGAIAGTINLDGALGGEGFTGGAMAGTIDMAGAIGGASTAGGALSGTIVLAGDVGGAGVIGGALAGTITLAGAIGGASIAAGSPSGTIALAGAAGGDTVWAWDGVTALCLTPGSSGDGPMGLSGSCTGGVGSWTFSGVCSVTVLVNAGAWSTLDDVGTLTGLSPITVDFPASAFSGLGCATMTLGGGTVSSDLSACSAPSPCGETADLTVGGPWAGGSTLFNTGTDSWSGSTGTCSAWVITWTGTTYHLSGNGNEIDATSWTCGPTHIYFDGVDASCDGFGTVSVDYYV